MKKKNPVGRPTKYDPLYPDMLIKHMEKGLSYETFAALLSVSVDTLYEWERKHSEFSEAKKIAWQKCRLFWEQEGLNGLYDQIHSDGETRTVSKLNSAVWIFNMKHRFNWKDKVYIDSHTTHSIDPKQVEYWEKELERLMRLPK